MHGALAFGGSVWLIEVSHPELDQNSYLQAEGSDGTYLLVFTTAHKAFEVIRLLPVRRGHPLCLAHNMEMELATAVCQVGARGIMVDFDAAEQTSAWLRDIVAVA
jgi:hypothetical protein